MKIPDERDDAQNLRSAVGASSDSSGLENDANSASTGGDEDSSEPMCSPNFPMPRLSPTFFHRHPLVSDAWKALKNSIISFRGKIVGTPAALDDLSGTLNYDQVLYRACSTFSLSYFSLWNSF